VADLSDEVLMAYADGLLDPAERIDVEASIRENPEYQRKVEKFRATLKPVHQAFQEAMDSGHLELAARISQEVPATTSVRNGQAIAPNRAQSRASSIASYLPWPTALAASLALLVGGGLGWLMHSLPQRDQTAADLITFGDGSLQAEGALAQLLETAKSGAVVSVRDAHGRAWQLKTIFSFRSVADVPCRRYELSNGATERFAGYACRDGHGRWRIDAHARIDAKVNGKPVFSPAGDSHENPVDAAIRNHMHGDVLQSSDEVRLIERHWSQEGGK
jgi:anti-sigma factor RsiW